MIIGHQHTAGILTEPVKLTKTEDLKMNKLSTCDFHLCVMRFVLQAAELVGTNSEVPLNHGATVLTTVAEINGYDKTDLLLALAPAVEQCRNGLNRMAEAYAQNLAVACLTK